MEFFSQNKLSKIISATQANEKDVANILKRIEHIEKYNERLKKQQIKRLEYLKSIQKEEGKTLHPSLTQKKFKNIKTENNSIKNERLSSVNHFSNGKTMQRQLKETLLKKKEEIKKQKLLKHYKIWKQKQQIKKNIQNFITQKKEKVFRAKTQRYFQLLNKQQSTAILKKKLEQQELNLLSKLEQSICRHNNIKQEIQNSNCFDPL